MNSTGVPFASTSLSLNRVKNAAVSEAVVAAEAASAAAEVDMAIALLVAKHAGNKNPAGKTRVLLLGNPFFIAAGKKVNFINQTPSVREEQQ
jgi:hypothetical protein